MYVCMYVYIYIYIYIYVFAHDSRGCARGKFGSLALRNRGPRTLRGPRWTRSAGTNINTAITTNLIAIITTINRIAIIIIIIITTINRIAIISQPANVCIITTINRIAMYYFCVDRRNEVDCKSYSFEVLFNINSKS